MAPKGKVTGAKNVSNKHVDSPRKLDWPPLVPVVPAVDLVVDVVLQDQILLIPNLFTSKLCKNYTAFLSTLPLVITPGKPKRGEATRVNDRFQTEDSVFAEKLWKETGLSEVVLQHANQSIWGGQPLGLYSNIRVYRYTPGQYFDKHYDESNKVDFGKEHIAAKTTWTLLIYLSSCEGGETTFYPEATKRNAPEPIVIAPSAGMALLHRHGDDCLLHEGKEVKSGEKWVLRSDLIVRL